MTSTNEMTTPYEIDNLNGSEKYRKTPLRITPDGELHITLHQYHTKHNFFVWIISFDSCKQWLFIRGKTESNKIVVGFLCRCTHIVRCGWKTKSSVELRWVRHFSICTVFIITVSRWCRKRNAISADFFPFSPPSASLSPDPPNYTPINCNLLRI